MQSDRLRSSLQNRGALGLSVHPQPRRNPKINPLPWVPPKSSAINARGNRFERGAKFRRLDSLVLAASI